MKSCPRCKSEELRKAGVVLKRQRYECKSCHYHFTTTSTGKPEELKRQALALYLEGLGFRSIGRILNVSHVAVYYWIKQFGENAQELSSNTGIEVVEMDEMHTYIASKKNTHGYGLPLTVRANDLSTVTSVQEAAKQVKNSGKTFTTK